MHGIQLVTGVICCQTILLIRGAALTAVLLAALLAWSCTKPVPPVPTPSVEGAEEEVRSAILTAHRQALAEPNSGRASGHFGMVLQAHAHLQEAAAAYERAIRLEPKE